MSYPIESYQPGRCDVCGMKATEHHGEKELCGDCKAMQPNIND